ncbi:elongation factor EF-2 [Candidatus Micrarchaeota archaeon]|nr:elongation factor EF-2 [Candidatus Micrarchaeota archaeon]
MGKKEFVVEEVQKLMHSRQFIRNIAIVAHVDHGKTTMTDSLVARAGLISRELAGQQRMLDFDEQEQARGITIKAAYISLGFTYDNKDYLINLIDTPGHVDFGGHVTRAMRAVDGIILVVDAVEGVMPQTETVLRQSLKEKAKPAVFINKIDRLINELKLTPDQMQDRLLKIIAGINKLINEYAPAEFKQEWLIGVEKGNIAFGSAYNKWAVNFLYMKKTGFNFKKIYEFCAQGNHKILVEQAPLDEVILGMVVSYHPDPITAQKYRIPVIWKGDITSAAGQGMSLCDASGKVCMVIFGVVMDEHAGEVGVGRIFSGTIKKGTELFLASRQKSEKVQQVGIYMGPDRVLVEEVPAGNIVAVVGLHDLYVGETASELEMDPFEQIKHYSEPVVTKSIEAKNTKDLVRLIEILRQIAKEDPTIKIEIKQETGEHLISGMGELHLEIIEYKIKNEKKCEIETSQPIVVYRETISTQAGPVEGKSPNKHTKIKVIVEPVEESLMKAMVDGDIPEGRPKGRTLLEVLVKAGLPREEARNVKSIYNRCLLIDSTKGVQYLDEIMELVLEGFEDAVNNGPLAREKVTGVKVKLVDATIHEDPVHRGPAQVIPASRRPIYAGMLLAGVNLLEPKQKLLVQCPQNYMSQVISQIQGRRGQVGDIQQEGETVTVNAKVPVADMFGFANDIRSATQGRAIWYTEYAGYEKMPRELQNRLVPQIRERKGEQKEPPTAQFFME